MSVKDALLEIGSEELPASFIGPGMRQLKALAENSLKECELTFSDIDVFGTPRRLAVVVRGLAERSPDQKKVLSGPPAAIAKDAQGHWTPAALGFARKQGLKPSDLTIEKDRLTAVLHIKGVATRQLLGDLFPQWISKLDFPKSMEWEESHFRYPRPIRWIAALYGSEVVTFKLAGVRAAKWTFGLGPWSPKKIPIVSAGKYALLLKNQCVLVEPAVRQEAIRRSSDQAVKRVHGRLHMNEALLDQVVNLVEHPVAILGNFDPAYLELPKEVLITCLEHHQKYFPVESASPKGEGTDKAEAAKLLPHFVGIRNGMSVHQDVVREGYERVLSARLADARFFFNQDRRNPLSAKVEALKGVTFQQKLGTVFEKKERIKVLLDFLRERISNAPSREILHRAADLCKADLVTDMVREFPELQGVMARLYARADGEDRELAEALEGHYWPVTLSGRLPSSSMAEMLALADKADTLAGDFAVGLIPSGSADPYGLRRAAVGVLRILEQGHIPVAVEALVQAAVEAQPASVRTDPAGVGVKLIQFMHQRLTALLEERGFRPDEIDAVLAGGMGLVPEALARLKALHELRAKPDFEPLAVAFKRGMNIVRQASKSSALTDGADAIREDLLKEACEKALFEALHEAAGKVAQHLEARAYGQALESMVPLREPLDGFFTGVMVMAEDPDLRRNRLALMQRLVKIFTQMADFSKLQNV